MDIVERLRNTPNWMRESYGAWKDATSQYDRAPFEAADEIERLRVEVAENDRVIAVWRGRTQRAEAERDAIYRAAMTAGVSAMVIQDEVDAAVGGGGR